MNFKKIKEELGKDKIRHLYIFVGTEREIMKKYFKDIDENYKVARNLFEIVPLLKTKSITNTTHTFVIKEDKEATKISCEDVLQAVGKHTVILVYETLDKVGKLGKTADEHLFEFEKVKDASPYVKSLIDLGPAQAKFVATRCGHDIRRIELEVDKLKTLKEFGYIIDHKIIAEMIAPEPQNRIWDFIDGVVQKNDKDVWPMLKELKELNQNEVQLLGALYNSIKQLLIVYSYRKDSDNEIMKKTGLLIWQVKKSRKLFYKGITEDGIADDLRMVNKLENDIKFGRVDPVVGFKNLLLDLLY